MNSKIAGIIGLMSLALAGCVTPETTPSPKGNVPTVDAKSVPLPSGRAARNFFAVVQRIEPVAERECELRTERQDCDFIILVDDRVGQPPNAFFTLDERGRPLIAFTVALLEDARNEDELAIVMGHEAAHHILGHIILTLQNQRAGAMAGAIAASVLGRDVREGANLGAVIGARRYSQDFELQADGLGTIIAAQAGYDPLVGLAYFDRIVDPGNQALGSHPANARRIAVVRETLAGL
ncbi:M48 family metallopeptidase [Cochlodiniinecator piscidefendens]|uniref:M48 family metallopeptidase n=1 Tax=Cochlodiniinecator piscidefendens TaxID=2715756 RepID=UPI00140B326A|nr:M48 family metallopeptidase [Cochlodiniinecator piscidefendens]